MQYYNDKFVADDISLFINVGGGIYSIGDSIKRKEIPPGIIYPGDIKSTMHTTVLESFLYQNIPVININHIYEPITLPKYIFDNCDFSATAKQKCKDMYNILVHR